MIIDETPGNLVNMVCTGTFPQDRSLPLPNHQNVLSKIDFQKGFEGNYFSAFWRLHPDKSVLDSTAVEAGHQAVQVSLGESNVLICVFY